LIGCGPRSRPRRAEHFRLVRAVFALYLLIIVSALAFYIVVGLTHH
jgi:hypothetical protein